MSDRALSDIFHRDFYSIRRFKIEFKVGCILSKLIQSMKFHSWILFNFRAGRNSTKKSDKHFGSLYIIWQICYIDDLLRSIFDMLMVLPVLRHWRHHPRDVINFRMLPLLVETSLPRSISDERHDDESSKLEPRRWRWKHAQLRSIVTCFIQFECKVLRKLRYKKDPMSSCRTSF